MNDRYFADFHIAGFLYHDGIDVFDNLKIGAALTLKAEPENHFDHYAVAIYYEEFQIGYVPRGENEMLSKFLNLGYPNLFEVRINQIAPEAHPAKQVRVVVRIRENKAV